MCPWSQYTPDPFPFCEEQLCSWIGQPANTWSNIGYFVVAVLILRNTKLNVNRNYFAVSCFALGIGSTLFHMSGALWAKYLDVGAMILLSSTTLTMASQRFFQLRKTYVGPLFLTLFLSAASFIGVGKWGGKLFLLQCILTVILEVLHGRRHPMAPQQRKSLLHIVVVFPIALALNMNDQNGNLCIPSNHIFTVHGLWHLMTAYCILCAATYFCFSERPSA